MNEEQNINEPQKTAFLQGAVISRLLCLINIHKPINKRFDSEYWYTNHSCERCGSDLGMPKWKENAIPKNGL